LEEQQRLPNGRDRNLRIAALQNAINGWQAAVDRVTTLHGQADAGQLNTAAAYLTSVTGFDTSQASFVASDLIKDNMNVGSAVVKPLPGSIVMNNGNELQSLSAFSFVGGGASLGFEEDISKDTEFDHSKSFSIAIDAGLDIQIKLDVPGLQTKTKIKIHSQTNLEFGDDTADSTSHGYGRSFSLGDNNDGDQFDLKACSLFKMKNFIIDFFSDLPRSCVPNLVFPNPEWHQFLPMGV